MASLLKGRLFWRFLALGVLTLCLGILLRNGLNPPLASARLVIPRPQSTQEPTIRAETQPGAPLVISSSRIISWDGRNAEVAMDLVNVSSKPIRAYAIRQGLAGEKTHSGQVVFINRDLTNKPALQPNQLTTNFHVYQSSSGKEEQVIFLVDYVEFSDGTKWGVDSANFAEHSAGQRAAAHILSKRLLKILDSGTPADVLTAIESGATDIEPPSGRSNQWKEGFRAGCRSVAGHLKRSHTKGGFTHVDRELRQLGERSKGGK
jgi:hypothetical protein